MNIKGYYGLEYITVEYVGKRIPASLMKDTEEAISRYIIEYRSPLRGIELKFMRKTLGISLAAVGERLGLSAPAILAWERNEHGRLDRVNEIAVRVLFAELLGVDMKAIASLLVGADAPTPRTFRAA